MDGGSSDIEDGTSSEAGNQMEEDELVSIQSIRFTCPPTPRITRASAASGKSVIEPLGKRKWRETMEINGVSDRRLKRLAQHALGADSTQWVQCSNEAILDALAAQFTGGPEETHLAFLGELEPSAEAIAAEAQRKAASKAPASPTSTMQQASPSSIELLLQGMLQSQQLAQQQQAASQSQFQQAILQQGQQMQAFMAASRRQAVQPVAESASSASATSASTPIPPVTATGTVSGISGGANTSTVVTTNTSSSDGHQAPGLTEQQEKAFKEAQRWVKRSLPDKLDNKAREAIINGKFVTASSYLTPPRLSGTEQREEITTPIGTETNGAQLTIVHHAKKKLEINSLGSFLVAILNWARCVYVLLPEQYADAAALVDYATEIADSSSWRAALDYFDGVRYERQGLVHKPWSDHDLPRYMRCVALAYTKPGSASALATNASSSAGSTRGEQFCHNWQKGKCTRTNCLFIHRCDVCDSTAHFGKDCSQGSSPGAAAVSRGTGTGKGGKGGKNGKGKGSGAAAVAPGGAGSSGSNPAGPS